MSMLAKQPVRLFAHAWRAIVANGVRSDRYLTGAKLSTK